MSFGLVEKIKFLTRTCVNNKRNNKREYFRDYEGVFQAFGVRGYSKLDSMAIPAPYIQHNFMDWDSLFSLDIRVELN